MKAVVIVLVLSEKRYIYRTVLLKGTRWAVAIYGWMTSVADREP